ncbi:gamma-tubulin complex component protein [Podospora aff. communis PSN243]|uniref:Spindle pole body component n=1 Tax=Podospora aff. communis PSN243 TaxID=3040156 RepID=A0AAV9GLA1_9PEZI|nr:gamma-tubulin complex component protein [Podospora aff. communis PSN243]
MLHEILLSLSGHPSPLFRLGAPGTHGATLAGASTEGIITPSERALLASLAHLGDLHIKLRSFTAQIAAQHASVICRAVAAAVEEIHLAAFQRKVLEVEEGILRRDAGLVGAYDVVPLTAVVGEFGGWTRRMEWLWEVVQFMMRERCTGAMVMDRLRGELQTGYRDVEEAARSLVRVAEVAWLKQVSAWILYGKLPSFGADDFFVQMAEEDEEEYTCNGSLLPSFVTPSTAASMLFVGRSLNQIRVKSAEDPSLRGTDHLFTQLTQLAGLQHPLDSATFSRTVTDIRHYLSRTTLQRLLPPAKVLEILQLLRDFFLLRRGEFAMALTQQADEKIRSRWRRAENLAYEKRDGLANVVIKDGEVAAVLARTWSAMGSMQGEHAEEDEGLELARDLLRLILHKSRSGSKTPTAARDLTSIAPTPFRNLLFSVPVVLTLQIPSPLDLFLSQSDLQTYTAINSYLLSLRRAHIRLTDLWKITSLRRHHPAPPAPPYGSTRGGRAKVLLLRQRHTSRSNILRNAWATASAAIFFLGETEGYLQTEVVAGLTEGFHEWLTTGEDEHHDDPLKVPSSKQPPLEENNEQQDDDMWLAKSTSSHLSLSDEHEASNPPSSRHPHDPQTLATAHRRYLRTLTRRLLLTRQSFTDPLYELVVHIDRLVALVHRLHAVWTAADLESDVGVVDAFVDLSREERDVQRDIRGVEGRVKRGIEGLIAELRQLEAGGAAVWAEEEEEGEAEEDEANVMGETGRYVPRRVGGVDRLLMKLDFGSWFGGERGNDEF